MIDSHINEKIRDIFSTTPDVWITSEDCTIQNLYFSLNNYMQNIIEKNMRGKIVKIQNTPRYNQSLFHFIQYFISTSSLSLIIPINSTLFFCNIIGKKNKSLQLSIPLFSSKECLLESLKKLIYRPEILNIFRIIGNKSFILRDFPFNIDNYVKQKKVTFPFIIKQIKEITYYTYDLKHTLSLQGKEFSNIRWHLNKFKRENYNIKIIDTMRDEKPLLHLIGSWKKHAIEQKGFSYIDMRSDKLCSKLIRYKNEQPLFYRVLSVDGNIASFHCGHPIGFTDNSTYFAHTVGITNPDISHLSEYAQMDFWQYIYKNGFNYINDGPSWRSSLEVYKKKYRPIHYDNQYWTTLSI